MYKNLKKFQKNNRKKNVKITRQNTNKLYKNLKNFQK